MTSPSLVGFYRLLDTPPPIEVEAVLTDDFQWEFSLPDRTVAGDRDAMAAFIAARTGGAEHEILVSSAHGQVEVLAGRLLVDGVSHGGFVTLAVVAADGRIASMIMRRSTMLLSDLDVAAR